MEVIALAFGLAVHTRIVIISGKGSEFARLNSALGFGGFMIW
jgi:hypothetical protein